MHYRNMRIRLCILTNDYKSSARDIVEFYNLRGGKERIFDDMNNGFGPTEEHWDENEEVLYPLLRARKAQDVFYHNVLRC